MYVSHYQYLNNLYIEMESHHSKKLERERESLFFFCLCIENEFAYTLIFILLKKNSNISLKKAGNKVCHWRCCLLSFIICL